MTDKEINTTKDNVSAKQKPDKKITEDNQSKVFLKSIRVSPIKLNLVVSPIRGDKVEKAINYLSFSNKRIAIQIKKALQSAIANAENNHQLDVDKLYVSEASVGKDKVMKRFRARARGRGAKILKPFSNLTIKLKEQEIKKDKNKKEIRKQDIKKKQPQKEDLKNGTKS